MLVGLVVVLAMIAGTWGEDDHFPFGPFKMYVSADPFDPFYASDGEAGDSPVRDTRIVGINVKGDWLYLHQANTGVRRAEIEGQLPRLTRHPELLGALATGYAKRRPDRPPLVRISVVVRWWEVADGRATGEYVDQIPVVWTAGGGR